MDVAAGEGMSLPGVRLWNRPAQVIPTPRKVRARRKRRKELVLIQICLFGGLLLVVKGLSYLTEHSGEGFGCVLGSTGASVLLMPPSAPSLRAGRVRV